MEKDEVNAKAEKIYAHTENEEGVCVGDEDINKSFEEKEQSANIQQEVKTWRRMGARGSAETVRVICTL